GARTAAINISSEIFEFPPPWPSTDRYIGKGYEFFTVGGKKMSTSKGAGIGFAKSTDYAPAQLLRYMLTKTRPHAALDFNPSGTNAVILLYDRYDKDERIYHGKEKLENKDELAKIKRIFEFSHIGKIGKMPHQVSFLHCAITIQAAITTKRAIELLKKTGHIPKKISKEELAYVEDRLDFARKWVNNFAEEQFKFQLKDRVDVKVPANIKKSLLILAELMKKNKYNEKSLYEEFYNICEKTDVEPKEFFMWSYKVLTGKEQGPRLAPFILTVGKDKVIKLFKQL
ncbi:lysine--tRNA ligase, partial [Candidatus Woesearchaeota archaeon]|nr:lysine--tRNA ligase [Candidatus Woesearchaeota archaeon]